MFVPKVQVRSEAGYYMAPSSLPAAGSIPSRILDWTSMTPSLDRMAALAAASASACFLRLSALEPDRQPCSDPPLDSILRRQRRAEEPDSATEEAGLWLLLAALASGESRQVVGDWQEKENGYLN